MTSAPQSLDPWLSMWISPRATVRQIIDQDPNRQVYLLAALNGIIGAFGTASGNSLGDMLSFPLVIGLCVVVGTLSGIIGLSLSSLVLTWMGRKLGGHGETHEVRAAIAWSYVPVIWGGLFLVPSLILFGEELFTTAAPRIEAQPILALLLLAIVLIQIVVSIWAFIIYLQSLGEAHGFSAWHALGTSILTSLLFAVPVICVIVAIGVLTLLGSRV